MARVELDRISKIYDGKGAPAVHELSLDIPDGEFLVLVGPSGCGKSSALRMLAGLESISGGEIRIDGKRVNETPPKDRDVAMVFQNYALYPHMSVFDNMAFGLKLRKMPREEIRARVEETATFLGLAKYLERRPRALSGGERQRVALGRALVRRPKLFLFDEPLSNLDAKLRVDMRAEISRIHSQIGVTMVYVTHDQVEAMTLGERIVVMRDGVLQQVADPLTLYGEPANRFVAGFIGSPSMNFVPIKMDTGGSGFRAGSLSFAQVGEHSATLKSWSDRELLLGVRPEHFDLVSESTEAIPGQVAVREQLGNEVIYHVDWEGGSLIGRAAPGTVPDVGEAVRMRPNMRQAHFFDPQNEARVS